MEFRTYVNKKYNDLDVEIVRQHLIAFINDNIQKEIHSERLLSIRNALEISGGSNYASRYGLDGNISFADSELINAYQRGTSALEYLEYRYEFKYLPMNRITKEFPLVVAVEASSRCNLRCRMCFQRNMDQQDIPQNHGIMDYKTYERFLEELDVNKLYSIVFASRGEPLLNPNIDKMILAAKAKGVLDIKLNTNAVLLTAEMSRKLLASGLDIIVFSVDSINQENYHTIRGVSLSLVVENINRFLDIKKKEFPESRIVVRVAMVITNGLTDWAEMEVQAAKKYWLSRVDELSVKSENDFSSVYQVNTHVHIVQTCNLLWERLYLWHDGTLNPCDIDHLSSLSLGNINDGDTIREIWSGKKMESLRTVHLYHRNDITSVCARCVGY